MIKTKEEYKQYLEADRIANSKATRKPRFGRDLTWRFLIALRKLEYHLNCNHGVFRKLVVSFARVRWYYYSVMTHFTILPNCFDKGLTLYHYGFIICNKSVRAGEYVTLQPGVVISENVTIGNNVYLAPGVKISKDIRIADNTIIGFNSVVTKSLNDPNGVYAGAPCRRLRDQHNELNEE